MQQSGVKTSELRELINEVKELQNKYQQLRTQSGDKSSGTSVSLREQRLARQNCSSESSASGYQESLQKLKKQFIRKGNGIRMNCLWEFKGLDKKIKDISRKLDEETNSCIFKMENNTQVDYVKNVQKVQINEKKNAAVQLVGVTCCSEYSASNVSNAVLEVEETISNITYACYCKVGQKCNICYWQCADTRRHQIK
ncbi:Hypothetical predicted protein [Paramuricea clavata]|nr:Hypothetical predicted protein [Paramuricea clavata]